MSKDLPKEVSFDDIKSYLLSLEGCRELKPWITFKMFVQQKIRETRKVIKADPKRCERFETFQYDRKRQDNDGKYNWRKHRGHRGEHGDHRGGHWRGRHGGHGG